MISYRPATQGDVVAFFGDLPDETVSAITVLVDDEPAALIGMARDGNSYRAFSDYKPALEPYRTGKHLTLMRAIKAAQRLWARSVLPVYALQEREPEILERLGFRRIDEGVYLWQP